MSADKKDDMAAIALTLITGGFEAWLIERKMEHVLGRDSEDANGQYVRTGRKAVLHKLAAEYLTERESELEEASLWTEQRITQWTAYQISAFLSGERE